VVVPITAFSTIFSWLRVIALLALLAPLTLGLVAVIQSQPAKKNFLSRPLIRALHLLQPWVRGWARFKGRMTPRGLSLKERETLDTLRLAYEGKPVRLGEYWSEKGRDRMDFVSAILTGLDRAQWPHHAGPGWLDHDIQIDGSLWSQVRIQIAAEAHRGGKWLLRCRFNCRWTYPSHLLLMASAFGSLFLAASLYGHSRWSPLFLLSLVIPWWWIRKQSRIHIRLIAKLVGDTAASLNRGASGPVGNSPAPIV
jgi:hypothetical protein